MARISHPILIIICLICACSGEHSPIVGHHAASHATHSYKSPVGTDNSLTTRWLEKEAFLDFYKDGTYLIYLNHL